MLCMFGSDTICVSHRDLGLVLSDNLSWDKRYKLISARAYKILGLSYCTRVYLFYLKIAISWLLVTMLQIFTCMLAYGDIFKIIY